MSKLMTNDDHFGEQMVGTREDFRAALEGNFLEWYADYEGEMSFDEICDALPLPIGTLNANLTELQFSGVVLALPGRRYGIDTSRTRLKDI